jgi:hypothetical protein
LRVELNQKWVEVKQNELSKKELSNVAPASKKSLAVNDFIWLHFSGHKKTFTLRKKIKEFS